MFRVFLCLYFFWAVPRARKKSDFFFTPFAETKKYDSFFSRD